MTSSSINTSKRPLPALNMILCAWNRNWSFIGARVFMISRSVNTVARYPARVLNTTGAVDNGVLPGWYDVSVDGSGFGRTFWRNVARDMMIGGDYNTSVADVSRGGWKGREGKCLLDVAVDENKLFTFEEKKAWVVWGLVWEHPDIRPFKSPGSAFFCRTA